MHPRTINYKRLSILFLTSITFLSTYAQAWLADPLIPLFPDSNSTDHLSSTITLDYARNSIADIHVLIKAEPGASIRFDINIHNENKQGVTLSQLIDVPVEQNTGVDSRTEQFKNMRNPDVIRRAPFRVYEAIRPLKNPEIRSTAEYSAFRLTIEKELMRHEGKMNVDVNTYVNGKKYRLRFTAKIHRTEIPSLKDGKFFYTNWFRLSEIESRHQVLRWSDEWFDVLEKYASMMAHGRQNAIIIPGELIHYSNNVLVFEEEKMIKYIDLFRKYGFSYFESPHLMHRGKNDDWSNPILQTVYSDAPYYSDQGLREIEEVIRSIKRFTTKYGLTDSWLQHISDEPTARQGKCYKDIVAQARSIYPEIKIMEATNDRDSIAGAIDIWCPLINDFQVNEGFFREREKYNEKVLVYTCLIPGGKWLNRLLDQERLRQVYFGWGAAKYNTFGYLHWGLNQYHADPWLQSVVHHTSPAAGANNFLPAGDTHILYPGENGPLSSVRFEAHRIGIEDYELLNLLKQKNMRKATSLIGSLFQSYTDYSLSIAQYRKTKKRLLQSM